MSWTVRPCDFSAAAGSDADSGAWRSTTVVFLPVSIAPVAMRIAPMTTAATPPTIPERRFERMRVSSSLGS
jgi:hypothetical protein